MPQSGRSNEMCQAQRREYSKAEAQAGGSPGEKIILTTKELLAVASENGHGAHAMY